MSADVLLPTARDGSDPTTFVEALISRFAGLSEADSGSGVTRLAYTPLERTAHEVFAAHMRDLGLTAHADAAGNTIAERAGTRSDLPAVGTGASHDSQMISTVCPVGMVFVPSRNQGVSHSPDELTTAGDLVTGIDVLFDALLRLDDQLAAGAGVATPMAVVPPSPSGTQC